MGYVFQENILFYGSLYENILFGRDPKKAGLDFDKVVDIADVKEFTDRFPHKFEEIVGSAEQLSQAARNSV